MGDYGALAKTHEVREFLEDAYGIEVLKVVHVEAAHDPADPDSRRNFVNTTRQSGNLGKRGDQIWLL